MLIQKYTPFSGAFNFKIFVLKRQVFPICTVDLTIDAHGLKIQGMGYLMFFAKIPRGGQGFQEKLPGGGPPILGFIAFLLTSVLKFI
jgi:hypothetical protein